MGLTHAGVTVIRQVPHSVGNSIATVVRRRLSRLAHRFVHPRPGILVAVRTKPRQERQRLQLLSSRDTAVHERLTTVPSSDVVFG